MERRKVQSTAIDIFVIRMMVLIATISNSSFDTSFCVAYILPSQSSSLTSKVIPTALSSSSSATRSPTSTRLLANPFDSAERFKKEREELEAQALSQELLAELTEAELARKKIERDIQEAEAKRRALDEQTSTGRNRLNKLQNGDFGAVNAARKFLDTSRTGPNSKRRPSRLDIERDRLELQLEDLKSQQRSEELKGTVGVGTIGGIAVALGIAVSVISGNSDLVEIGDASTTKYLSDTSPTKIDVKSTKGTALPYLDEKIVALEKKMEKEEKAKREEAKEIERLKVAKVKEDARIKAEKEVARLKSTKEAKDKEDARLKAAIEAKEKEIVRLKE